MAQQEQRVIQRPEWGARHEDGFGPRRVGNLLVYVHHSVTIAPDLTPPFTDDYAAVRELERIGEARFGRGISYQFPITPAGLIFEGVSIDRIGAAIENFNTPTANIVWVGNYDVNRPPLPMLEATDWLLHHGVAQGWWRNALVDGGHQDAPGAQTACPGRYAEAVLSQLNRARSTLTGPCSSTTRSSRRAARALPRARGGRPVGLGHDPQGAGSDRNDHRRHRVVSVAHLEPSTTPA